jgi:penicillin-binding protein 2
MNLLKIANFIIFFTLLFFAFKAQVVKGSDYYKLATENILQRRVIVSERGFIKDKHGILLAQSVPRFRLVVDRSFDSALEELPALLKLLQSIIGTDIEELEKRVSFAQASRVTRFVLASNIPPESLPNLEPMLAGYDYAFIETEPARFYPLGEDFSHILGFVGEVSKEEFESGGFNNYLLGEFTGKEGLEKSFEQTLRGENGIEIVEIDAQGRGVRILSRKAPARGETLNLTIDANVQKKLYQLLEESVTPGSIIVSDTRSGNIMSAVNYPSFDNNVSSDVFFSDPKKPLFNRFLSGLYPPGSVFKLVMATAALSEGVVSRDTKLEAPGSISYGTFTYKDWKAGGHGTVNIVSALAKSADTFFYKIGGGYNSGADISGSARYEGFAGLGVERIAQWAKKFGLGAQTGIDLPGESPGLVPTSAWKEEEKGEPWYIGNTYHLSIGQGDLLTTPLQTHFMTSIVAAGGRIYKPNLIEGKEKLMGYLDADLEVLDIVKEGMVGACSPGGTAYPLFGYAGQLACKTGTSETSVKDKTHAWLTMFYPVSEPRYAITVFLENGGGGSQDAAPVAKEVYEYLVANGYE